MAKLDFNKLNNARGLEPIDTSMVDLVFNLTTSKAQKNAGILGKVTIHHPAFTTRATLFENKGIIRVNGPALIAGGGKPIFNIVTLEPAFREEIIREYHKEINGTRETGVWYKQMLGTRTKEVTNEVTNESLDIKNLIVMANLSEKQLQADMLCKVTIVTSVASLRSYTVLKSKFGQQLYGVPQNEDVDNTVPAYKLSRETEAQILNLIHPVVTDWGEDTVKQAVKEAVKVEAEVERAQDISLQTEVPVFDASLYND